MPARLRRKRPGIGGEATFPRGGRLLHESSQNSPPPTTAVAGGHAGGQNLEATPPRKWPFRRDLDRRAGREDLAALQDIENFERVKGSAHKKISEPAGSRILRALTPDDDVKDLKGCQVGDSVEAERGRASRACAGKWTGRSPTRKRNSKGSSA